MPVLGYKTSEPEARGRRRLLLAVILTCFSLLCLAATMWFALARKAGDTTGEIQQRLDREEQQRQQLSSELRSLQQRLSSLEGSEVTGVKTDVGGVKTDLGSTARRSLTDP